jgi:hydrogenase maturation protease
MTSKGSRTLVIGAGNEWRGDDGAGLAVARRLRTELPSSVCVIEHSGEGASLMDSWRGDDSVTVVDAAKSGAPPGTIHRFTFPAEPLPDGIFGCSSHSFGIAEVIQIAVALHRMPRDMVLYGIEGLDFADGAHLSPAVELAVAEVADRIRRELQLKP